MSRLRRSQRKDSVRENKVADGGITDEDVSEFDGDDRLSSDESSLTAATPDHPPEAEDENGVVDLAAAGAHAKPVSAAPDMLSASVDDDSVLLTSVIIGEDPTHTHTQAGSARKPPIAMRETGSPHSPPDRERRGSRDRAAGSKSVEGDLSEEGVSSEVGVVPAMGSAPASGGVAEPTADTEPIKGALSPAMLSKIRYDDDKVGLEKQRCRCTVS